MKNFLVGLGLWFGQTLVATSILGSVLRISSSRSWQAAGEALFMLITVAAICISFHTIGERFRR